MESVYGTKKYFQSLGGNSDIYRAPTCRASANEYSSYQNTLGRHSTIGPYMHMNKHPAYSTDLSLSSQYGYNTWGAWPDARNISPTDYSQKSRQSVKSFSIILTTAAFIVLLAVVSIGGLAFYFSTFKSNLEDPIMAFEGSFRIQRGDAYTSALRYNHTSVFRQKADFYKRFIDRSLSDNDIQLTKTDVTGFGEGPLIDVHFMVFLDMRKIPQTIHSVEEHIRNSLFLETNSVKSLYKSLKIEPDSVEVKRIIDENIIKMGSIGKDQTQSVSQTHFEKRLTKKAGQIEKAAPKLTTNRPKWKPSDGEPEVDVANAPVIQGSFEGSFEITKTDADITEKKATPTKSFSPYSKYTASSIAMRSKTKNMKTEKSTTPLSTSTRVTLKEIISTTEAIPKTSTTTSSTTTTTTAAPTKTTTTSVPAINTTIAKTSSSAETTISQSASTTLPTSVTSQSSDENSKYSNVEDPPKLDMSLFTSAPVLDTEPWHPMRPSGPPYTNNNNFMSHLNPTFTSFATQPNFDAIESGLIPRNKIKFSDPITDNPNEMLFYQSFTNPVFMPGTSGIEKLGNTDVKPHPLPLPLIDDVVAPDFRPVLPMHKFPLNITSDGNQFEHIGGGVVVMKKPEIEPETSTVEATTSLKPPTTTDANVVTITTLIPEVETELSEKIGDLLLDLLEIPTNSSDDYKMESRIEEVETDKPSFLNIKEMVLNQTRLTTTTTIPPTPKSTTTEKSTTKAPTEKSTTMTPTQKTTIDIAPRKTTTEPPLRRTTTESPLGTIDQSMLFPSHTKWEYVNGSSDTYPTPPKTTMKKVFNTTLQAWIVENQESTENISIKDLKIKRNTTENIQNISSIFDTLASKLGIASNFPTKVPPFSKSSQNKLKQSQNSQELQLPGPTRQSVSTQNPNLISITSEYPQLLTDAVDRDSSIMGEAEVEVVDPTKYEEILSSQSARSTTMQTPTLVTLLPVRSNSGIRTFRPMGPLTESRHFNYDSIVKTGIQVTA